MPYRPKKVTAKQMAARKIGWQVGKSNQTADLPFDEPKTAFHQKNTTDFLAKIISKQRRH
ncbi:hypothetical protein HC752_11970 [Vibrio sp. S9_S30]|uniref:hypothetical protein n=1 Tax=Vibrio sp. S9_S30 TaxID=2720226 RepID=UPI0016816A45|nr:hypothetical protein [Vibrio sp. S9_S30]MBD1557649.1 hypothetical protein [Vibrio sp. S9_S30]